MCENCLKTYLNLLDTADKMLIYLEFAPEESASFQRRLYAICLNVIIYVIKLPVM